MILLLTVLVGSPSLADSGGEMFEEQCEFTRRLNALNSPVVADAPQPQISLNNEEM